LVALPLLSSSNAGALVTPQDTVCTTNVTFSWGAAYVNTDNCAVNVRVTYNDDGYEPNMTANTVNAAGETSQFVYPQTLEYAGTEGTGAGWITCSFEIDGTWQAQGNAYVVPYDTAETQTLTYTYLIS
jgi:hypothetical protein